MEWQLTLTGFLSSWVEHNLWGRSIVQNLKKHMMYIIEDYCKLKRILLFHKWSYVLTWDHNFFCGPKACCLTSRRERQQNKIGAQFSYMFRFQGLHWNWSHLFPTKVQMVLFFPAPHFGNGPHLWALPIAEHDVNFNMILNVPDIMSNRRGRVLSSYTYSFGVGGILS
jgi:hypothetical protein